MFHHNMMNTLIVVHTDVPQSFPPMLQIEAVGEKLLTGHALLRMGQTQAAFRLHLPALNSFDNLQSQVLNMLVEISDELKALLARVDRHGPVRISAYGRGSEYLGPQAKMQEKDLTYIDCTLYVYEKTPSIPDRPAAHVHLLDYRSAFPWREMKTAEQHLQQCASALRSAIEEWLTAL
jgi:hypothetical protein